MSHNNHISCDACGLLKLVDHVDSIFSVKPQCKFLVSPRSILDFKPTRVHELMLRVMPMLKVLYLESPRCGSWQIVDYLVIEGVFSVVHARITSCDALDYERFT